MLTRTGYLATEGPLQEIKKELTVRPIVNGDYGFPPPPFKVFKTIKNGICVPRFYGVEKLGEPKEDRRPQPTRITTKFVGTLRDATHQNEALAAAPPVPCRPVEGENPTVLSGGHHWCRPTG